MATKKKQAASETKVTRIKATDTNTTEKPAKARKNTSAPKKEQVSEVKPNRQNPLKATGGYFKGAWQELKQVRWPTRRATWGMTAALVGFTAFFVAFILLLDALFKYSFELMLG